MEVAKEAGALLSYDPNLRLPLWPSPEEARKRILSIWERADIIKVSDNEVEFLTGCETLNDDAIMSLWHPGLKLLLVTLGEKGCKYYSKVGWCLQRNHVSIFYFLSMRSLESDLFLKWVK